jgi:hypothetical protein
MTNGEIFISREVACHAALARFLQTNAPSARRMRRSVSLARRVSFLRHIVFPGGRRAHHQSTVGAGGRASSPSRLRVLGSRVPRRLPHPRPAARRYPPALRRRLAMKATPPNPIMRLLHSWSSEMCWDETAGNREVVPVFQYPQSVRLGSARAVVGVDEMRHGLKAEEIRVGRRREEDVGR